MSKFIFNNVRIAGLACAVPSFVQKIDAAKSSTPDYVRSFQKQTGMQERHISLTEQTATDLAYGATQRALEHAGWDVQHLDALIFLSQTPDFNPGTGNAFIMHHRLRMPTTAMAYDITLGCASVPAGLATACSLLQQESMHRILLLCGDAQWHFYADKAALLADQRFIHGEGVTATLLERVPGSNSHLLFELFSDGSGYRFLFNPIGGVRNAWRKQYHITLPDGVEANLDGRGNYMDGLEITSFSTGVVVDNLRGFLCDAGTTIDNYDGLVLHQANMQIVKTIAKRLHVPMEKVPISLDRYGNTSGASPLLTMCDAYSGLAKQLRLLICAFGIGLAWGIADIEIDTDIITPIFNYDGRSDEFLLSR